MRKKPSTPQMINHHSGYAMWTILLSFGTHGSDKLEALHRHLNSLRESIQLTIEKEENDCLPFLDVLVKKEGNCITTSIHRKKTHTDHYLHYQSYHHPRVKSGIISYLWARAETVCTGTNATREKEHLCDVFVANGYPEEMTRKSLHRHKSKRPTQTEEDGKIDTICLPYIQGLSEDVERAVRDLNIRAVFKTTLTLRH